MTSAEVSGVSLQNFGCHGNCCAAVGKQEILSEGHLEVVDGVSREEDTEDEARSSIFFCQPGKHQS